MAERTVSVEFVFDRTGAQTLAQVYRMLVPERRARSAARRYTDDDSPATTGQDEPSQVRFATPAGLDDERALGG